MTALPGTPKRPPKQAARLPIEVYRRYAKDKTIYQLFIREGDDLIEQVRTTWEEYPRQFWTLIFGALINSTGGGLIWPFFSLYLTRRLNFSMTEVGIIFAAFAVVSVVSLVAGGALVDRLGRKPIMLFSLFGSALGIMAMGLTGSADSVTGLVLLAFIAVIVLLLGLAGSAFGPAVNAMVADLVDGQKRAQAYGLLRVMQNLGVAIGPAIGGFIATRSYLVLFTVAALSSAVYGLIITLFARETKPKVAMTSDASVRVAPKDEGFGRVLCDQVFMLFCGLSLLSQIVYSQMNTTCQCISIRASAFPSSGSA
jgi:MFS family permease